MSNYYKTVPILEKDFDRDDALRDLSMRIATARMKHEARFML